MDDLTRIEGIGEATAEKLAAIGVGSYKDIAELSDAKVAELDSSLSLRGSIDRKDWRAQAKDLMSKSDEDEDEGKDEDDATDRDAANDDGKQGGETPGDNDDKKQGGETPGLSVTPSPAAQMEAAKAAAPAPAKPGRALDFSKKHAKVYGRVEGYEAVSFTQDGRYFDAAGRPSKKSAE